MRAKPNLADSWRPLAPGEWDWERLYVVLLPVSALLVSAWFRMDLPTPKCVFHEITGVPCVSCGATRAAQSLMAGDSLSALRWNPLAATVLIGMAAVWFYAAGASWSRRRFRPPLSPSGKFGLRVAIVAVIVANWVYLLATLP